MHKGQRKTERREALRFLREVRYLGSWPDVRMLPDTGPAPLIAFTGRSNSGKSSLISALCDQKNLARTSAEPGKTRSINLYRAPPGACPPQGVVLADLPGFGYARTSHAERAALRRMVDQFLLHAPRLSLTVLVLDCRREPADEELSLIDFCRAEGRELIFARSKWDKLSKQERLQKSRQWQKAGYEDISIGVSNTNGEGMSEALESIALVIQNANPS